MQGAKRQQSSASNRSAATAKIPSGQPTDADLRAVRRDGIEEGKRMGYNEALLDVARLIDESCHGHVDVVVLYFAEHLKRRVEQMRR